MNRFAHSGSPRSIIMELLLDRKTPGSLGCCQKALQDLIIDTSIVFSVTIDIQGISSYEDYKISKDKLLTLIGVTDLDILSFKNNIIKYQANIMGDINSLSRDIDNNSFFEIDGFRSSEDLNLIYKK